MSILVTYLTHYVLFGMALLVPVALGLGVFRAVAGKTGYGAFFSLRSVDDLLRSNFSLDSFVSRRSNLSMSFVNVDSMEETV